MVVETAWPSSLAKAQQPLNPTARLSTGTKPSRTRGTSPPINAALSAYLRIATYTADLPVLLVRHSLGMSRCSLGLATLPMVQAASWESGVLVPPHGGGTAASTVAPPSRLVSPS